MPKTPVRYIPLTSNSESDVAEDPLSDSSSDDKVSKINFEHRTDTFNSTGSGVNVDKRAISKDLTVLTYRLEINSGKGQEQRHCTSLVRTNPPENISNGHGKLESSSDVLSESQNDEKTDPISMPEHSAESLLQTVQNQTQVTGPTVEIGKADVAVTEASRLDLQHGLSYKRFGTERSLKRIWEGSDAAEEPKFSGVYGDIQGESVHFNKRQRSERITPEEVLVYLEVIMDLLKQNSLPDVLKRIRRNDWDWLYKGANLKDLIIIHGKDKIPKTRVGLSMKSYFKTHLGHGDYSGEIQNLFSRNLAPNYTTLEQEKFFQLINEFKAVAPGTSNFISASENPNCPRPVKQLISKEETMCLIIGIREALYSGISVQDLVKVLKSDKWDAIIASTQKSLLDTIRYGFDKQSTRPAASYRSKLRAMLKNKTKLREFAEPAFHAKAYQNSTWLLFLELIVSYDKQEALSVTYTEALNYADINLEENH